MASARLAGGPRDTFGGVDGHQFVSAGTSVIRGEDAVEVDDNILPDPLGVGDHVRYRPLSGTSIRVGTDLCLVEDVVDSVETFGNRYLRRVYTDHELEYCGRDPARTAERLAARFAAKEAVVKVLRPRDARPEWRTIEVQRDPGGWCELSLTGSAAMLAREAGIDSLSVSMSHEAGMANAVVVATLVQEPHRAAAETRIPSRGNTHK